MKNIEINTLFENFPLDAGVQTALLEEYHQKYPASHFVTFFYLKMLQERTPKKYEALKSKLLLFVPNRQTFHNSRLEYFTPDYFTTPETTEDKPDEIAALAEQLQQNIPKIKFDPDKHDANMDLSAMGEIADIDFISETLAMVYAEQGYTGKAVQMLKKLMVQNPEKNAYFAALIENVKNAVSQEENNQ
jgi:hypothetical protein